MGISSFREYTHPCEKPLKERRLSKKKNRGTPVDQGENHEVLSRSRIRRGHEATLADNIIYIEVYLGETPHDHSHSVRQPPNHITTMGTRYVVKARDRDIFCLLAPLSTVDVPLLLLPFIFGSTSTRGGTASGFTTGGDCLGISGGEDFGS